MSAKMYLSPIITQGIKFQESTVTFQKQTEQQQQATHISTVQAIVTQSKSQPLP